MPLFPPTYLVDSPSNQQWLLDVDNNAIPRTVPVSGIVGALDYIDVNDYSGNGDSWRVTIVGNPPPAGESWGQYKVTSLPAGDHPTQIVVTAPNGTAYAIVVNNGLIASAFPSGTYTSVLTCDTPVSTLADHVQDRLEEPRGAGRFWRRDYEIYSAIAEAMNDLMVLVGRPTETVAVQFNLTPNNVWQTVPKGVFLIADVWGAKGLLRKLTLFDLDYSQSSWSNDWESDISDAGPVRWAPIGMTRFLVHPAPSAPQTVLIDAIQYPVSDTFYPPNGNEIIPFHNEFHVALEQYAAHYCRLKEGTSEFQESMLLYQEYLNLAQRLTMIEDRRDPVLFSAGFGATGSLKSHTKR